MKAYNCNILGTLPKRFLKQDFNELSSLRVIETDANCNPAFLFTDCLIMESQELKRIINLSLT